MRFRTLARLAAAAMTAASAVAMPPASAATAAEVRPGMQVVDPAGGTVGTVTAVKADNLILKTDKHELMLPLTSFTAHEGKLMFGMTAAQLNAETEKAISQANAAVTVGAQVYGAGGTLAGQIEALDDSLATIKLTSGELIRIPRSGLGAGPKGVALGLSVEELKQLAAQASSAN